MLRQTIENTQNILRNFLLNNRQILFTLNSKNTEQKGELLQLKPLFKSNKNNFQGLYTNLNLKLA